MVLLILIFWLTVQSASGSRLGLLLINCTAGTFQGHTNVAGVRVWKGIRYAMAPVKEFRWSAPESPPIYSGVFEANVESPGCPQDCEAGGGTQHVLILY